MKLQVLHLQGSFFPISSVIFCVGQNMTDIHFAAIKMDRGDEPIFVAADIENDPVVYFIGGRENLSQFGKTAEFGLLHNLEPTP